MICWAREGKTSSGKKAPAVNSKNSSKRKRGPQASEVQNPQQPVMKLRMKYSQVAPTQEVIKRIQVGKSCGHCKWTWKIRISPKTSIIEETKLIEVFGLIL